ncbi:MAG: hypothetical protein HY553_22795 [Elusimicrobia bacterium]|nr:hypothetical protein [Elusimicrobiota bacterium]
MALSVLGRELARKAWHILILVYLALFLYLGRESFVRWMALWTVLVVAVETVRLSVPAAQSLLLAVFGPIVREREVHRYSGMVYTTLGVLGAAAFWGAEPRLVTAAVLSLALADASAALVGIAFGRVKFTIRGQTRSVEGAAAGFAVACLCGAWAGLPWGAVLAGAAAVTTIDCLPVPPDDNLWIPLASAAACGAALGVGPSLPL